MLTWLVELVSPTVLAVVTKGLGQLPDRKMADL